jgi:hypothetical protein
MSPPISPSFEVQHISGAGRGVVANSKITAGHLLYQSEPPASHVIFWEYRKESCATCFHYDRGRTLPVRLNEAGKVFCSESCQTLWFDAQGDMGLGAWKDLNRFIQKRSKDITNAHSLPSLSPKPEAEEVKRRWAVASDVFRTLRQQRQANRSTRKSIKQQEWQQAVDADILSYLLSGILLNHHRPSIYQSEVLDLAMDPIPYKSPPDLEAHCNSFLQLCTILPPDLLSDYTPSLCQTMISAASHNSFGIRSGSDDGDEYLGYGLYPGASYFNHSCRPNIGKKREGNAWEFRALRDILPGEECCITYLGGDEDELTVVERWSRLKLYWGFDCVCIRCREEDRQIE